MWQKFLFLVNKEYLLTSQDVADIVQIFETHDKYLRRSKIKMFLDHTQL